MLNFAIEHSRKHNEARRRFSDPDHRDRKFDCFQCLIVSEPIIRFDLEAILEIELKPTGSDWPTSRIPRSALERRLALHDTAQKPAAAEFCIFLALPRSEPSLTQFLPFVVLCFRSPRPRVAWSRRENF
jgi:hypothetical protein